MQVTRGTVDGESEARDGGGDGGEGAHGWGGGNGVAFWREREPQKLIRERPKRSVDAILVFLRHICGSSTRPDVVRA